MRGSGGVGVVGTDTGVGKTVVTAVLAMAMRRCGVSPAVMKPVAAGGVWRGGRVVSGDAVWLRRVLEQRAALETINPVCFRRALAPWVAAGLERTAMDFAAVRRAHARLLAEGPVLVEGAGGVLVPLSGRLMMADLLSRLRLTAVLVGRAALGTINHTLLSLEALRRRRVPVAGVILNGARGRTDLERGNVAAIERFGRVRVVAVLPRVRGVRTPGGLRRLSVLLPGRWVRALAAGGTRA